MERRVAFRLEANETIGSGHLMRCMTIIYILQECDIKSTIYTESEIVKNVARKEGVDVVLLKEKAFSREEAKTIIEHMRRKNEHMIIFDSYDLNKEYIGQFKSLFTVQMADEKSGFDVNMVIQPNAYLCEEKEVDVKATIYLKGLEYLPLRAEFFQDKAKIRDKMRKVLILSGGIYPEIFLCTLLDKIFMLYDDVEVGLVLGKCASKDAEKRLVERYEKKPLFLYRDVRRMGELMRGADVAISACGMTIYELMASGVPIIGYSMADNQKHIMKKLCERTEFLYAGDMEQRDIFDNIMEFLKRLEDVRNRRELVCRTGEIVSKYGAQNIVNELIKYV